MKVNRQMIDHESCWGCRACEVACKQENNDLAGVRLIKVLEDGPRIIDGKPDFTFRVNACRHCDEPACVEVCPEEAIFRRDDGIVVMNDEKCTGCRLYVWMNALTMPLNSIRIPLKSIFFIPLLAVLQCRKLCAF